MMEHRVSDNLVCVRQRGFIEPAPGQPRGMSTPSCRRGIAALICRDIKLESVKSPKLTGQIAMLKLGTSRKKKPADVNPPSGLHGISM